MTPDEIDTQIIELLQQNARRGNRDIARKTGVSEGTVRYRIRNLVQTGTICFTVLQDPFVTGLMPNAFLRIVASSSHLPAIRDQLIEREETVFVASTAGRFNLIAYLHTQNEEALRKFVSDEVAAMDGFCELDVRIVVEAIKYDWRMVSIPPSVK